MIRFASLIISILVLYTGLYAQQKKRVLVLDFINVEKKKNYQYLEKSITDTVKAMLSQNFVYDEMPDSEVKTVCDTNYLFRDEFYTKSVAFNLGLLASQDLVISGDYRVEEIKNTAVITTGVRIVDVKKRTIISDFSVKGPADDKIWNSVREISNKIQTEISKVLPNREQWSKMPHASESTGGPVFSTPSFALWAGGYMYTGGWAKYFKAEQPTLGLSFRWNIPWISKYLAMQTEFRYMRHSLKEGNKSFVQAEGYSGWTTNYYMGLFPSLEIPMGISFILRPRIGGGMVYQTTTVSGKSSSNFSNNYPFAGGGADLVYMINKNLWTALGALCYVNIEKKVYTYANGAFVGAGVNL